MPPHFPHMLESPLHLAPVRNHFCPLCVPSRHSDSVAKGLKNPPEVNIVNGRLLIAVDIPNFLAKFPRIDPNVVSGGGQVVIRWNRSGGRRTDGTRRTAVEGGVQHPNSVSGRLGWPPLADLSEGQMAKWKKRNTTHQSHCSAPKKLQ